MKWIYLKSNNLADALALSTVIASIDDRYNIVRRSNITKFFLGLENVNIAFYQKEDESDLLIIDEIDSDSWKKKCDVISSILEVDKLEDYAPYNGFVKHVDAIEKYLLGHTNCLLYLLPHPDQNLDLIMVDQLVRLIEQQGFNCISGGSPAFPCIKGTKDLRLTIDFDILCAILPSLSYVITTDKSIATLCEAYKIKGFVLSGNESIAIDGLYLQDANQILNYINLNR